MAKQLIGRAEEPDGLGGWKQVPGFKLYSTNLRPIVSDQIFHSYAEAARAAAGDLLEIQRPSQVDELWAPRQGELDALAKDRMTQRRVAAVERYVQYAVNPAGSHFIRKVILCDESGDLPVQLQPPCPVLVMKEGESTAVDTVANEVLANAIAAHLNLIEGEKRRSFDRQPDDVLQDGAEVRRPPRWRP